MFSHLFTPEGYKTDLNREGSDLLQMFFRFLPFQMVVATIYHQHNL